jgi:hypothetical protein
MEDFLSKFQNTPTKDLLKMTGNPSHYQQEAVDAASRILAMREITDEDVAIAAEEAEAQQKWLNREADILNKLKSSTVNFLTYLLRPSDDLDVKRWVYIVCIVTALQYLTSIFNTVNFTLYSIQCESCSFGFIECLYLIDAFLPIVVIVLLLKRNKWGWRLLIFSASVIIALKIGMAANGWRYISASLPQLIVNAGMLWFTYKQPVMAYFGESKTHYIRAVIAGVLFSGFVMLYTQMIN